MSTAANNRRGAAAILAILAAAALLRGIILFTGQRWLRSDEAVVALMAKHVFSRGERFLFLYGQPYGGGHAIEAYVAAPFFKLFGPSAILLTAIPALISLLNVFLLWLICKRLFGERIAAITSAFYAFAPPVVYQSFLVNGGTESFCLSLLALLFFVRAYYDDGLNTRIAMRAGALAGLFGGLSYYAMDYGLLYPIVFAAMLIAAPREGRWRFLAAILCGFVVGCAPLIAFNLSTGFANLRQMGTGGATIGLVHHVADAFAGIFTGDLAGFVGGEVDDIIPAAWPLWVVAYMVVAATALLIYGSRAWISATLRKPLRGPTPGPQTLIALFIVIYLAIYLVAKFSLPGARTPRYFMPLAPFLSISLALALAGIPRRPWMAAGIALASVLICLGAAQSLASGTRTWHYEHRIRISGPEMDRLAERVRDKKIKFAFAPYEIQWRLMFAADEDVIVSGFGISPLMRYPGYDEEVLSAAESGQPFAFILRRDFAFEEWAARGGMGMLTRERFIRACREAGVNPDGEPVGDEFSLYWPLDKRFLEILYNQAQPSASDRYR